MSDNTDNMDRSSNGVPPEQFNPADDRIQELLAENERLRAENAQTRIERDDYLKALYRFAPQYMFTAEEIQDMIANRGSGRKFIEEIYAFLKEAP